MCGVAGRSLCRSTMFNMFHSRCSVLLNNRNGSLVFRAFRFKSTSKSSSSSLSRQTHYEVLGLSEAASPADVKEAFVKLSKQIHPDINPSDPDNHAKFVRLNEAYSILSKTQSRREYDMSQGQGWVNTYNTSNRGPYRKKTDTWYSDGAAKEDGPYYAGDGSFYPNDSYYGIKGVRRMPNYVIAAGCAVVVGLGFIYFIMAYRYTVRRQRYQRETMDRRNLLLLKESQNNARINGLERQLELLTSRSRTPTFNARQTEENDSPPSQPRPPPSSSPPS